MEVTLDICFLNTHILCLLFLTQDILKYASHPIAEKPKQYGIREVHYRLSVPYPSA
jgi:hypothetical protein